MAQAPAHKFGQIIGGTLESAFLPRLRAFAKQHSLYLDRKGYRKPARRGKKVSWTDEFGNVRDLDFVLERGGSRKHVGQPVAFIESAWRRYTKHSRNKAQEIQGAILLLRTTHRMSAPFVGAILAGDFTEGALAQMKSLGFTVLYINYAIVFSVFAQFGIDAYYDEDTPDALVASKIKAWESLPKKRKGEIAKAIAAANPEAVEEFLSKLSQVVLRYISSIRVLPLHGRAVECDSIEDAIHFLDEYRSPDALPTLVKFEVQIRYDNGDRIDAEFSKKIAAVQFLESYRPENWTPGRKRPKLSGS